MVVLRGGGLFLMSEVPLYALRTEQRVQGLEGVEGSGFRVVGSGK